VSESGRTPVVGLERVAKRYGRFAALQEVSLDIAPGEVIGLLGHNGAGKTTLMKLILGLSAPSAGRVRVFGLDPNGKQAHALRPRLGYLPESIAFYDALSGREVLDYFARLKGVGKRERETLLERVGLAEAAGRRVKTYSKGMRQRLGLAQALLGRPELLLLDEPTVGLDPMATRDFYATIDELRGEGHTVILSSHILTGIEQHITRAVILGRGRLLVQGPLESLWRSAGLSFKVRVRGRWSDESWLDTLPAPIDELRRINGSQIEFAVSHEDKLAVVRAVLARPEVQDLELAPPGLEALYVHFDRAIGNAAGGES